MMAAADHAPPLPITCALSEHRAGRQVQIEALIRSDRHQAGLYTLWIVKSGPAGSAQVSQESEFTVEAGTSVQIRGLTLSLEPEARYRAILSVKVGSTAYTCERNGPEDGDTL